MTSFISDFNISKIIKKIFISLLMIICLNTNTNFILSKSIVSLPFTYINKKTNNSNIIESTPKDYFESLMANPVYTTIKINNKDIKFHLTTERHTIYISEKTLNQNKDNVNDNSNSNLYSLEYIGIPEAQLTNTQFPLLLINSNNIIADNISYFIAKKISTNSSNFNVLNNHATENEEIGFNIYKGNPHESVKIGDDDETEDFYDDIFNFDDNKTEINKTNKTEDKNKILKNGGYKVEEYTNLIKQLKTKDIIGSYTFLIKYNNKNEEKGEIIMGGLPHEYDPEHYSEDYFIYDSIPIADSPPYNWHVTLNKIEYDNNSSIASKYAIYRHVAFSLDFGFILAHTRIKDYLDKNFFDNYKDLCSEVTIDKYIGIYCQKEVVENFKNLTFYLSEKYNNKNNKIEFDYTDLFIKSKDNPNIYYFQMIFSKTSNRWVLGRPLFKKYPTIFDQDKKIIGFYLHTNDYSSNENINNEEKGINWSLIIIIFLVIVIIVLGIILYKVIPLIKRKKKANELDEDFDYESHNENKDNDNDNKLFNN